jgi:imidazolonepropionase-like amidohydrolase
MTPMQAIVAATGNGADYLGLKAAGTLVAGKQGDFIVLDANPLEDITNSRRIARIFVKGREVNRDSLRPGSTQSN